MLAEQKAKEILEQRRDSILKRIEGLEKDIQKKDGPLDPDLEEQVSELENNDVLDSLNTIERDELRQINASLVRIAQGTYGTCQNCGEKISASRLKAIPYAITCVDCAK